jgi:hypothetical protein
VEMDLYQYLSLHLVKVRSGMQIDYKTSTSPPSHFDFIAIHHHHDNPNSSHLHIVTSTVDIPNKFFFPSSDLVASRPESP